MLRFLKFIFRMKWTDREVEAGNTTQGAANNINKAQATENINREGQRVPIANKPKRRVTRPSYMKDYA